MDGEVYAGYFVLLLLLRPAVNPLTTWFRFHQYFWPEILTKINFVEHCIILYLYYIHRHLTKLQRFRKSVRNILCSSLTYKKITSLNCWAEHIDHQPDLILKWHTPFTLWYLYCSKICFILHLNKRQCTAVCILTFLLTSMYLQPVIN